MQPTLTDTTELVDETITPDTSRAEEAREIAEINRQKEEIITIANGYERAITQIPTQGTQERMLQDLLKDIIENDHFMLKERSKDCEQVGHQLAAAFGEKKAKLEELFEAHNRLIAAMQQFEIEMTSGAHSAIAQY